MLKFPSKFFTLQPLLLKRFMQNLVFAERVFCIEAILLVFYLKVDTEDDGE